MDQSGISLEIHQQNFVLLPERCVFWKEAKTIIASDLHWGKIEVFHKAGIPIPRQIFHDDLRRLEEIIHRNNANRLLILGDLIHSTEGISREVNQEIIQWRKKLEIEIELIEGNHDRGILPFLDNWRITHHKKEKIEGDFLFSHHSSNRKNQFTWSGHVHPTIRLKNKGKTSLRFPCFVMGQDAGLLPAFSHFTGGQNVEWIKGINIFAIVKDEVIPL